MSKLNKKDVLKTLISSAKLYKANLENKNILIISKKNSHPYKFWELKFEKKQFKHLTGINSSLSSTHFYKKALTNRLSINDFELRRDGTTELKLLVLPSLMNFKDNIRMIGEFEDCSPKLFTEVLAGNIQGALGFVHDTKNELVPNTCLKCNTSHRIDAERIVLILSKNFSDNKYSTIEYITQYNFNIEDLTSSHLTSKHNCDNLCFCIDNFVATDKEN